MAKTRGKKSTNKAKASAKRVTSNAKGQGKSAAAKKASKRAAIKPVASRGGALPESTDIRQAYKSFLLADYLGEKKASARRTK